MKLETLGKFFRVWYLSILMMIVIFVFSNFGSDDSNRQSGLIVNALTLIFPDVSNLDFLVTLVRKMAHFTEYALLGFFTARALNLSGERFSYAFLIAALYAASDEFHQSFVPGRSAEVRDVLLDSIGASFGILIYALVIRIKKDR